MITPTSYTPCSHPFFSHSAKSVKKRFENRLDLECEKTTATITYYSHQYFTAKCTKLVQQWQF